MSIKTVSVRPHDRDYYVINFGPWLEPGETISAVHWDIPKPVDGGLQSSTDTAATFWYTGAEAGQAVRVMCWIETTKDRRKEVAIDVIVER
jgi:hypothetical protein